MRMQALLAACMDIPISPSNMTYSGHVVCNTLEREFVRAKCCIHSPVQNGVQRVARVIRRGYERPVQRIVQLLYVIRRGFKPQRQCINTGADARSTYLIRRDFEGLYDLLYSLLHVIRRGFKALSASA